MRALRCWPVCSGLAVLRQGSSLKEAWAVLGEAGRYPVVWQRQLFWPDALESVGRGGAEGLPAVVLELVGHLGGAPFPASGRMCGAGVWAWAPAELPCTDISHSRLSDVPCFAQQSEPPQISQGVPKQMAHLWQGVCVCARMCECVCLSRHEPHLPRPQAPGQAAG